jgi:hypothetical protein
MLPRHKPQRNPVIWTFHTVCKTFAAWRDLTDWGLVLLCVRRQRSIYDKERGLLAGDEMSSEWTNLWNRAGAALLIVLFLYGVMRPVKDYYVLQRLYFDRLNEHPWRGKLFSAYYHGFTDYLAAKAAFELHQEFMSTLDGQNEVEHSLFMIPARSKSAAIARLKAGKAYDKELLHKTPIHDILKSRAYWQKAAKEGAYTAEHEG